MREERPSSQGVRSINQISTLVDVNFPILKTQLSAYRACREKQELVQIEAVSYHKGLPYHGFIANAKAFT